MGIIEETGTVAAIGAVESGVGKTGNEWHKRYIVVSIDGKRDPYDKVALNAFNDRCNYIAPLKVGDKVKVSYSISAREHNGKWYNDVSLFNIEKSGTAAEFDRNINVSADHPVTNVPPMVDDNSLEPQAGDLPF